VKQFMNKLFKRGEEVDLTPYVIQARRGLRRDVKAFASALPNGKLFIPLSRRLEAPISGQKSFTVGTDTEIFAHTLTHPDTKAVADALFTKKDLMTRCERDFGWKTDGGQLEYCAVPGNLILELVSKNLESGRTSSLVINPFHDSMLELQREEVLGLVKNEPIPLKHYLVGLPVQEDEKSMVGAPANKPSRELVDTILGYVLSHSDLSGYDLFQMFNEERDVEAHLGLNIYSKSGKYDEEISNEIQLAIHGKLPPPGYIDILFNSEISEGIQNIETYRKP